MGRSNRRLALTLLCLTLLVSQVAMVRHQASHHGGHPDAACAQCLAAAPLGGGPVAVGWPLFVPTPLFVAPFPVVAGVPCTPPRAARARAPPLLV